MRSLADVQRSGLKIVKVGKYFVVSDDRGDYFLYKAQRQGRLFLINRCATLFQTEFDALVGIRLFNSQSEVAK